MKNDDERLNRIFDKTRGKCHLCHKRLSFGNYNAIGSRRAWEIEHSRPKSLGGTNHMNNLYVACISCNRQKGNRSNFSVRSANGLRKAPLSASARTRVKFANTAKGAMAGAAIGRLLGPGGIVLGGAIGALMGSDIEPDE